MDQIRFEAPHLRPIQDAVHLGGFCEDDVIRNLQGAGPGATIDDRVALNANANDPGARKCDTTGIGSGIEIFGGEFGLCRDGFLVLDSGGYAGLRVGEMHNTLQERNHVRH